MRSPRRGVAFILAAAVAVSGCASGPSDVVGGRPTATGEYLAGRLAARVNAIDDAARAFETASSIVPGEASIQKGAFFYHVASGDIDGAAPYAERIAAAPSPDERAGGVAALVLAARELKAGRYAEARARLAAAPAGTSFIDSLAFSIDVWIEDALQGPKAAIAKLDKPPEGVFAGFSPLHRGLLADKIGAAADARAGLESSVFGLGGPVGREAFGAFLERSGDAAAARAFYNVLARQPGAGRRLAEAAELRLASAKPSTKYSFVKAQEGAAIATYTYSAAMMQQVVDEQERARDSGFNLGEPQYDVPLALAQIALYLDPGLDDARRMVADVLNIYGHHAEASALLRSISPESPHFESARAEMASALIAEEKPDEAAALLKAALRDDPNGRDLRWTLAGLYADQKRHREAIAELTKLIDSLPAKPAGDAWRYFISRAASRMELAQWPAAETDLKRAVEIAPEEPTALNYLGYSWAERGVNLEKAFELIEKAVAAEPRSGAYIDSLGWAHYQRGDYAEAVPHLEKAAALEPGDPTITDHLGDLYWRLGRTIEARYQWSRALQLEPTAAQKSAIETKLKDGLPALSRQ